MFFFQNYTQDFPEFSKLSWLNWFSHANLPCQYNIIQECVLQMY